MTHSNASCFRDHRVYSMFQGIKTYNIYFRPSGVTLIVNDIVSNFKCVQLHSDPCESMRMKEIYH